MTRRRSRFAVVATLVAVVTTWLLGGAPPRASAAVPPLLLPVPGRVLASFRAPAADWSAGHRGVDLAAQTGTTVRAAAAGEVVFAGFVVDRPVMTIKHPDADGHEVLTSYEPATAGVRVGERVTAGQPIGVMASGGHCSGRCLHWGLRIDGRYADPMLALAGDLRLLPASAQPKALSRPPASFSLLRSLPASYGGGGAGQRPADGPVTSPFGMRFHPILHRYRMHDGVDIGAACGTPVRSGWAGTVVLTERNLGYGNRVIVDHGEVNGRRLRSSYNHLSSWNVLVGQVVRAGQQVGSVGSTGMSTGCHLHFSTWVAGQLVDPLGLVNWR